VQPAGPTIRHFFLAFRGRRIRLKGRLTSPFSFSTARPLLFEHPPAAQGPFAMGQRFWQSRSARSAWVAIWLLGLLLSTGAQAQEASDPPKEKEPAAQGAESPLLFNEVGPPVYYFKDKNGKLQAVPGFSLEEFIELFKLKNQLDQQNQQPSFTIDQLTLTGSSAGAHVELIARFSVRCTKRDGFACPCASTAPCCESCPAMKGRANISCTSNPRAMANVSWLRGEPDKTHQLSLKLLAKVSQIGPEAHLRLNLPRVAVSTLQLQVPLENAVAKVSDGSTLESIRKLDGGRTELKVMGLGSECDVAWHAAASQVANLPTILEASGNLLVRINGRSVNTEAKLNVRSFGGEFDQFQVRLPPGADYVGTPQPGASLIAVDAEASRGKLYEVKLDKKTAGPVEIRLVTERAHNPQQAEEMLELAGFEVAGAVRQWGTIAVQVQGNWQVLWGQSNHVRQVDEFTGPLPRDEIMAGFEYFVQPYSLTARVVPQRTRVRAEGEYVLLVGSDQAELRGKVKYTIRGAKVRALEIEVPGWEVDTVGPASVVDVNATVTDQTSPFVIPLLQPASGELELTFEAHQKISGQNGSLSLELPRPLGEVIVPATVAVLAADNIELVVQPDQITGLVPQALRPQIKQLPERQQDPLYFMTEGSAAKFVASAKIHEQAVAASTTLQLEVDDRETRIDQRVSLQISYQHADHLTLGVPRVIRPDRLSVTLDGQKLSPTALRERVEGDAAEIVPMRFVLPAPRIGRCELQVNYVVPHEKLSAQTNTLVTVPLVIPGEGQVTTSELIVTPKSGIAVSYPKGPWVEDPRNRRTSESSGLALMARRALGEIVLALSSKERHVENSTTIDRAWIQTRLNDSQRQDRAIYHFTTSEPSLKLSLPPGADLASLELEIDSRAVKPQLDLQRDLVVGLAGSNRGEHLLELRYHFTEPQPTGQISLTGPQIKSANWIQQLYWQVILPANEHLLGGPRHFSCECAWVWKNLFWQRQPSLEQRELEVWLGTTPSATGTPKTGESPEQVAAREQARLNATNRYLFSTAGVVGPLEVFSISRAKLVFFASFPLLVCGLLLIYFPTARHPAMLFVLAMLVAAASLIDPDTALLLAQAASLGVALALMAAVLARTSIEPVAPATPVRGSSRAIERSATEMYQRAPGTGSHPASTNPLVSTSAPEGE